MALKDMFNASKIKEENETLKRTIEEIGANDLVYVRNEIVKAKEELSKVWQQKKSYESEINLLNSQIQTKKTELVSLDEQIMLESFALYIPKYEMQNSNDYKIKLDAIRESQKNMIKNNLAVTGNMNWTVNNDAKAGKKMVNDMIKLVLRSFNNECDTCIQSVKFNNVNTIEKRISSAYDSLNKLATLMQVAISPNYKQLKMQELYLAHEYQLKKQEEKEKLRAMREQMREEARVEKELEEARQVVYKEQNHYKSAMEKIQKQFNTCQSEEERKLLLDRINDFNLKLSDIEKQLKDIDYRASNKKAGYVYVISNIGAFGENVYKIGMTRRLEPQDRVDELGDASVPFKFDVHAMIFSDDAPRLESALHKAFEDRKVNMINSRREFFKVSLDEVEKVIKKNHDKLVEFVKYPEAKEFRESYKITGVKYSPVKYSPHNKDNALETQKSVTETPIKKTLETRFVAENKDTINKYEDSIKQCIDRVLSAKSQEEKQHHSKMALKFINKFKDFCYSNDGKNYFEVNWRNFKGYNEIKSISDLERISNL